MVEKYGVRQINHWCFGGYKYEILGNYGDTILVEKVEKVCDTNGMNRSDREI